MREKFPGIPLDHMMPVDRMFYITAFQAGVDQFVSPIGFRQTAGLDFLKDRVLELKDADLQVFWQVSNTCQSFSLSKKDTNEAFFVKAFLVNLICAMQTNAALLSVVPVPDPSWVAKAFAPGLAAPLTQLIAQLEPNTESVPVPARTIERANVERFQAIISSTAFRKYSQAHAELERTDADSRTVFANIRNTGNALLHQGKRLLAPKPSVLHILRIVPEIVDTIFGKLPGVLAQLAGNMAQDCIDHRKQIVIHQFDRWLSDYSAMQFEFAKRLRE